MKTRYVATLAAILLGALGGAASAQGMPGHAGMATSMDANGDGVISKDEFMRFHEAMFDRMKSKDGVIPTSNLQMDCPMMGGMMRGGAGGKGMMGGHGMMGGGMMNGGAMGGKEGRQTQGGMQAPASPSGKEEEHSHSH